MTPVQVVALFALLAFCSWLTVVYVRAIQRDEFGGDGGSMVFVGCLVAGLWFVVGSLVFG